MDAKIRNALRAIYLREGTETFRDPMKLQALLPEIVPDESEDMYNLESAISDGVCAKLMATPPEKMRSRVSTCSHEVSDTYAIDIFKSRETIMALGYAIYGEKFPTMVRWDERASEQQTKYGNQPSEQSLITVAPRQDQDRKDTNGGNGDNRIKSKVIIVALSCICIFGFSAAFILLHSSRSDSSSVNNSAGYSQNNLTIPVATPVAQNGEYVQDTRLLKLSYLQVDSHVNIYNNEGTFNTGDKVKDRIIGTYPYQSITYYLNGQYERFTARYGLTSGNKNTSNISTLEIYADGKRVYSSPVITAGVLPVDIDINIAHCNLLTIMFCQAFGDAMLGDATLSNVAPYPKPSGQAAIGTLPCWLTEKETLSTYGRISTYSTNYPRRTNNGIALNHTLYGLNDSYNEYYLRGEYKRLTGVWAMSDSGKNSTIGHQLCIYADQELVYSSPYISGGDLPVPFDVDIRNCDRLVIAFVATGKAQVGQFIAGNLRLYAGNEDAPMS